MAVSRCSGGRSRRGSFSVELSITIINKEITSNALQIGAVLQTWSAPPQLVGILGTGGKLLRPNQSPSTCIACIHDLAARTAAAPLPRRTALALLAECREGVEDDQKPSVASGQGDTLLQFKIYPSGK